MNTFKICAVISAIIITVSCSPSRNDYSGTWRRNISDSDLGITGSELLILSSDSSLEIHNRLNMAYNDSNFSYKTTFTTTISGFWAIEDNKIVAYLDSSSYIFDTIPGMTVLCPIRNKIVTASESTLNMMSNEILANLKSLYQGTYIANNILLIEQPVVISDTILSGVCGKSPISWTKLSSAL